MTPPGSIGAMSSSRVILGELLSSRARFRFPGQAQAQPSTPIRLPKLSEWHTGLFQSVSPKGFTPPRSCFVKLYKPQRPAHLPHSTTNKDLPKFAGYFGDFAILDLNSQKWRFANGWRRPAIMAMARPDSRAVGFSRVDSTEKWAETEKDGS